MHPSDTNQYIMIPWFVSFTTKVNILPYFKEPRHLRLCYIQYLKINEIITFIFPTSILLWPVNSAQWILISLKNITVTFPSFMKDAPARGWLTALSRMVSMERIVLISYLGLMIWYSSVKCKATLPSQAYFPVNSIFRFLGSQGQEGISDHWFSRINEHWGLHPVVRN